MIVSIAAARSVLYRLIFFSLLGSDMLALTHVYVVCSQTLKDSSEAYVYGLDMNCSALACSRRCFQARAVSVPIGVPEGWCPNSVPLQRSVSCRKHSVHSDFYIPDASGRKRLELYITRNVNTTIAIVYTRMVNISSWIKM